MPTEKLLSIGSIKVSSLTLSLVCFFLFCSCIWTRNADMRSLSLWSTSKPASTQYNEYITWKADIMAWHFEIREKFGEFLWFFLGGGLRELGMISWLWVVGKVSIDITYGTERVSKMRFSYYYNYREKPLEDMAKLWEKSGFNVRLAHFSMYRGTHNHIFGLSCVWYRVSYTCSVTKCHRKINDPVEKDNWRSQAWPARDWGWSLQLIINPK